MTLSMGIALILLVTYGMDIVRHGMSILLGIYIEGSISGGGLITAIWINIPGTPASVATTLSTAPPWRSGGAGRHHGSARCARCLAACSV